MSNETLKRAALSSAYQFIALPESLTETRVQAQCSSSRPYVINFEVNNSFLYLMDFILQASFILWVEGAVDESLVELKLIILLSVPGPPRNREGEERNFDEEPRGTYQDGTQKSEVD